MAIEKNIKINVDTKAAVSEVDKLDKSFKDLDQQTEKTSKGVDDVAGNGGAIAILDGLTGGLATRFRDAYEATKLFNFSLKGTRTALIATGIGLFVVALAAVVAYWDEINDFMEGTSKRLDNQLAAYERITSELEHQQKINKLDQDIAKAKGESTVELIRLERELLIEKQKINSESLINLEAQLAIEQSKVREITLIEKGLIALKAYAFGYDSIAQSAADAMGLTTVSELQSRINALREVAKQTELEIANIDNAKGDAAGGDGRDKEEGFLDALVEAKQKELEILNENELRARESLNDALFAEEQRLANSEVELTKLTAAQKLAIEEGLKNAKIAQAQNLLANLSGLATEGSALAKGIAASQATINTFQGVTAALSATSVIPDPFGSILKFVNAAAIGVSGAINVQKILATKPVTTGAPSVGGSRAPAPPSFNLVSGTASNQINNSINSGDNTVKAIVVSKDVTSGQEADRNSVNNSTL
jgi:hypothetical protein